MPEYYRHTLANGKTVMETAPTIEWGYLIYLTVLRLCQYFGAHEECGFCDINHNWRQHKQGRPAVHRREARRGRARGARADRPLRRGHERTRTRSPAARSRATVDGLAEADFYGRYAQAIEERFPGRWIGKVVAQALPRERRAALQGLRDLDLPPELRGLGQASLLAHLARQGALRRPRGVAPPDPRRGRDLRPAQRDPELRRRGRDGAAVRLRDDRRGDRIDDRGPRLLHEPRRHAALHDLVP